MKGVLHTIGNLTTNVTLVEGIKRVNRATYYSVEEVTHRELADGYHFQSHLATSFNRFVKGLPFLSFHNLLKNHAGNTHFQ